MDIILLVTIVVIFLLLGIMPHRHRNDDYMKRSILRKMLWSKRWRG